MDENKKNDEIVVEENGDVNYDASGETSPAIQEENEYVIVFKKPYIFEGKEYLQVDLSPVLDMSTGRLKKAEKQFASSGNFSVVSEMTITFACIVAHMATKLPLEFFENLPANEGIKVKNVLIGYFYS